jgi:O-antigen ligase
LLTVGIGIVAAGVQTFANEESLVTPANFSVQERLSHWTAAVEMAKAHPFVGVGAGNYDLNYRDFTQEWRFRIGRGHAHDTYLHFLAQSGVVGLTAYIALLLGVSLILVRTIRILPGGSRLALLIGAAGITAATGAHAVFEYVHVLSLNLQLVVIWAMAIAIGTDAWDDREHRA